jgi:death-on-curing protein
VSVEFLELDEVLEIHAEQIAAFGGSPGVRDRGLLESALAQPSATAFGELLHHDLFEMAAAYLFHLVKNHAFIDGNKRTGLVAALSFLEINGVDTTVFDTDELYGLTMGVADGRIDKAAAAIGLRQLAPK